MAVVKQCWGADVGGEAAAAADGFEFATVPPSTEAAGAGGGGGGSFNEAVCRSILRRRRKARLLANRRSSRCRFTVATAAIAGVGPGVGAAFVC